MITNGRNKISVDHDTQNFSEVFGLKDWESISLPDGPNMKPSVCIEMIWNNLELSNKEVAYWLFWIGHKYKFAQEKPWWKFW